MRKNNPVCRDGIEEKPQQAKDLRPCRGILAVALEFVWGGAAVLAVSFGPGWVVPVVLVAYAAAVI
jgi:fatty acid desaturase